MKSKQCNRVSGVCQKAAAYLETLALVISLTACSGGGGDAGASLPGDTGTGATTTPPPAVTAGSLNQAAYVSGTSTYRFGHRSIRNMVIADAPSDADYTRWAMLHDGSVYQLYLGKTGNEDAMYQFGYNPSSSDYEFGYSSISQLSVADTPVGSFKDDFAMLHDGTDYRFYYLAE